MRLLSAEYVPPVRTPGPGDEYWQAVMDNPLAEAKLRTSGSLPARCGYRKFSSIF
jgi:hypothetical protein